MLTALALFAAAQASPVDFHGYGAPAMGRAGGGVAIADDAGAVFLNPAGLSGLEQPEFMAGFAAIRYRFEAIPDVWWDTDRDGRLTELDDPLAVDLPFPAADGFMLARPLGERFGVGMDIWLPRDRLFRLHTFEAELPTYFLYENRPHRYALAVGAAAELPGGLHLGAGLRMLPTVDIDTAFSINTVASGGSESIDSASDILSAEVDVHDITVDLKAGVAPTAGLRWDLGALTPALRGVAVGGTWRGEAGMPVDIDLDMQINATAEDIGELEPTTISVILLGSLALFDHYVPGQLQGGLAWTLEDTLRLHADLIYTRWERFTINIAQLVDAELQSSLVDLSDLEVSDANVVGAVFRNTLGWRTGAEVTLPEWPLPGEARAGQLTLRGGFGYDPSPLYGQTTSTTLLDADRLIIALGASFAHGDPFAVVAGPLTWDIFAQYQPLARAVLSREADEPEAGYPVEGEPIPIGGDILAVGLQWRMAY
jgi:hypothetical protein